MVQVWGVDSSQRVVPSLLECVRRNFGTPAFWGRYLTTVQGASEGLTQEEISFLRTNRIRVLPIYNDFSSATGYRQGSVTARNAAFHASRLGFPDGVVLFANVERFFPVDAAWIRGFVETMYGTGYRPGFYHDPVTGGFNAAFCQAAAENNLIRNQSILWSAQPEIGATARGRAPAFHPAKVNCEANVWIWQYGRDAETCPIDTNLAERRLMPLLW
jgi:Domain of unknown function (DUF1906).